MIEFLPEGMVRVTLPDDPRSTESQPYVYETNNCNHAHPLLSPEEGEQARAHSYAWYQKQNRAVENARKKRLREEGQRLEQYREEQKKQKAEKEKLLDGFRKKLRVMVGFMKKAGLSPEEIEEFGCHFFGGVTKSRQESSERWAVTLAAENKHTAWWDEAPTSNPDFESMGS